MESAWRQRLHADSRFLKIRGEAAASRAETGFFIKNEEHKVGNTAGIAGKQFDFGLFVVLWYIRNETMKVSALLYNELNNLDIIRPMKGLSVKLPFMGYFIC